MKMCEESETKKNERDLILLQIHHQRSNQLANMLIAINGFILAFISGLLTFIGSSAFSTTSINNSLPIVCINPWPVIIGINIALFVTIFWRFYAHFIDDDIIKTYGRILSCEQSVEFDASLLKGLLIKIEGADKDNLKKYRDDKELQKAKRKELIEMIDLDGNLPSRGHMGLDCLAFIICCVLCIVEFILFYRTTEDFILIGSVSFFLTLLPFSVLFSKFRKLEFLKKNLLYDKIICFLTVTIVFTLIILFTISYGNFTP